MSHVDKSNLIKDLAREIGFDLVGVSIPVPHPKLEYYRDWLARGYAGDMRYLYENREIRENPALLLENARSVICVGLNYRRRDPPWSGSNSAGRIAQYARGPDYHVVIRRMLEELVQQASAALDETFESRICVDTAPILERALAASAGLGWIGKNTMLINRRLGSYFFLGEVFTTLELSPDEAVADACGECRQCLDACPTRAIVQPGLLNASRCISYLTIEHRAEIAPEFYPLIGDRIFGCDICQEVCPYNPKAPTATCPAIIEERLPQRIPLQDLVNLRSGEYRRLVKDTAARRITRQMWRRNAVIVRENLGKPDTKPQL